MRGELPRRFGSLYQQLGQGDERAIRRDRRALWIGQRLPPRSVLCINYPPDDIWIGDGVVYGSGETPVKSVYKVNSSIPDDHWPNRRLRQYELERIQSVLVGGQTVEVQIDRDCAFGLVAGTGGKKEEPECFAK